MPCLWQALDQLAAKEDMHPLPVWSEKEREAGPKGARGQGGKGARVEGAQGGKSGEEDIFVLCMHPLLVWSEKEREGGGGPKEACRGKGVSLRFQELYTGRKRVQERGRKEK